MSSVLDKFNQVYKQLLQELEKTFNANIEDVGSENYLREYVKYLMPHMNNISVCNEDFFKLSKSPIIYFNESLSFGDILNHPEYQKKKTKISFWKFLHTLYIISTKLQDEMKPIINKLESKKDISKDDVKMINLMMSSKDTIMDNLRNNKLEDIFTHDTFPQEDEPKSRNKQSLIALNEMVDDMKGDDKQGASDPNDFMTNSLIGKLAGDLLPKINPKDAEGVGNPLDLLSNLFGSGGASGTPMSGGIVNIFTTVINEIQTGLQNGKIDGPGMMEEASKMMGGMFPPGMFPPSGMAGGQVPAFPGMAPDQQANFFRQMGAMGMMQQMAQMPMNQGSVGENKNLKKKVIRRKKK